MLRAGGTYTESFEGLALSLVRTFGLLADLPCRLLSKSATLPRVSMTAISGVARTDIVPLRPGPSGETIKTRAAVRTTAKLWMQSCADQTAEKEEEEKKIRREKAKRTGSRGDRG